MLLVFFNMMKFIFCFCSVMVMFKLENLVLMMMVWVCIGGWLVGFGVDGLVVVLVMFIMDWFFCLVVSLVF